MPREQIEKPRPEPGLIWRLWYVDELRRQTFMFDNTMGNPEDAPDHNCICVLQKTDQPLGRPRWEGTDTDRIKGAYAYLFLPTMWEMWTGAEYKEDVEQRDIDGVSYVKVRGIWTVTPAFQEILHIAYSDPDFPNATDRASFETSERGRFDGAVKIHATRQERVGLGAR